MTTYTLQDLLHRWARSELDAEQMTDHILQHLIRLEVEFEIVKQFVARVQTARADQGDAAER
jgi:hypothetical protein